MLKKQLKLHLERVLEVNRGSMDAYFSTIYTNPTTTITTTYKTITTYKNTTTHYTPTTYYKGVNYRRS